MVAIMAKVSTIQYGNQGISLAEYAIKLLQLPHKTVLGFKIPNMSLNLSMDAYKKLADNDKRKNILMILISIDLVVKKQKPLWLTAFVCGYITVRLLMLRLM